MQLAVADKPVDTEDVSTDMDMSTDMDIVQIDQGLVELTNVEDVETKKVTKGTSKKKVEIEEINLDSDSEEEVVAVVGADHL